MRTQEEEIMKTVNGFVVAEELDDLYLIDGEEYILVETPFVDEYPLTDGINDEYVFTARAVKVGAPVEENGNTKAYRLYWKNFAISDDDENNADWEHPTLVEDSFSGFYNTKTNELD